MSTLHNESPCLPRFDPLEGAGAACRSAVHYLEDLLQIPPERKLADPQAILLMLLLLSAMWGFNQAAIKLAAPEISLVVLASILYHGVLVAFASYLTWLWFFTRYRAAQLAVFSFLTPLIGVAFGGLILGDLVSVALSAAALLVGTGIAPVNLSARSAVAAGSIQ